MTGQLHQQLCRQLTLPVQLQLLQGPQRLEVQQLLPCCITRQAAAWRLPHLRQKA
jgi:hypothetical protein